MPSLRQAAVNSLNSSLSPEHASERHRQLAKMENPLRRAGALAIHSLSLAHPEVVAKLAGVDYHPEEMQKLVGRGWHSLVFREFDIVSKVNKRAAVVSNIEKAALAKRTASEYDAMAKHMADFVLPQDVDIDLHPVLPELKSVLIWQNYHPHTDTQLFGRHVTAESIHAGIERLRPYCSNISEQLKCFLAGGRSMQQHENGLVPDLSGDDNLVLNPQGRLIMIDAQPHNPVYNPMHPVSARNLDYLEVALKI